MGLSELLLNRSGRSPLSTSTALASSSISLGFGSAKTKPAGSYSSYKPSSTLSSNASPTPSFYDFSRADYRVITPVEMLEVLSTVSMALSSEYFDVDKGKVLFVGLGLEPTDYNDISPNQT